MLFSLKMTEAQGYQQPTTCTKSIRHVATCEKPIELCDNVMGPLMGCASEKVSIDRTFDHPTALCTNQLPWLINCKQVIVLCR